jgi:hypothetical protein
MFNRNDSQARKLLDALRTELGRWEQVRNSCQRPNAGLLEVRSRSQHPQRVRLGGPPAVWRSGYLDALNNQYWRRYQKAK